MTVAAGEIVAVMQQFANVVILASLPIAGCSLAVSVIGGLTDRKRPFSMLRLAGSLGIIAPTMPLLRRITGPETARNE